MDENQQDRTKSNLTGSEIKLWLPPLSPKDQEKLDSLHNKRLEDTIKHLRNRGYKVTEEYSGDTPEQLSKVSLERPPRKTWWDWLQLLIIPLLIAMLGIGFTWVQNRTSLQIAQDQQRETTLKAYLDDISDLLLNHKPDLRTSKPGDEIRQVAKERTLTTLRRLDADRNRIVLRFLRDAHLIGTQDAVINLIDASLSGADLTDATLSGASLSDANLRGADLSGATLTNATLNSADLSDTDLSDAGHLTQQQLDTVSSCTNAILSTGLICHHSGSITLTYWYTEAPAETPVILQLIQQFEQLHPNIKINAVYQPYYQTQAVFVTAAQAGKAPDVLRADVGWVTQFASQGVLLNIDSYISQSDPSDYLTVPLSYDTYKGHFYGLPQVTDFLALLYNKAELAKVGITSPRGLATMADFEAAAIKIVQSKAATYGFETDGQAYYALPFLWAFGGGMIDQHYNILVNNKGSVKGLTFLLKLQNTDKVIPAQMDFNNGYTNMVNDFKSGQTAMIFDGPYEVSNILTGSAFTGNPSNVGIAAVPIGPSGNQPRSPLGGQSYVISAGTRHPVEAYKFISFMSSTASQVAIAEANHTLPTRRSAYQDPGVSRDPVISAFHAVQNTAVARPSIPQNGYLFYAFNPNIEAAFDGAKSPTDALNAVADAWKQLLAGS